MQIDGIPIKGRGAQSQVANSLLKRSYGVVHWEGIDEPAEEGAGTTRYLDVFPKTVLNKVKSQDLRMEWSLNPYQGCEHGCAYCYARPTHEYWGYGAGLDFERVVLVKRKAPELLEAALRKRSWDVGTITLSGNTDCYQPIERKLGITRQLLEVAQRFRQPVGIITKNALVLRDLDILVEMAENRLASVAISLTTLDEELRRKLEPRTSSAVNRLKTMESLARAGVPVQVMVAPIIPGLNDSEVPRLLKAAADAGAGHAGYTILRTNGPVEVVFREWLAIHYPERAAKVVAQVADAHGGTMSDSTPKRRMQGTGNFAVTINRVFSVFKARYFAGRGLPAMNRSLFCVPPQGQLDLFR
jgi:DNA repair photolyase